MDTFAFVISSFNDFWTPIHVPIGLFKVHEIKWFSMVGQLHTSLKKYDLMNYVIVFVKDENNSLMSIVATPLWPSVKMKLTLPKLGTWSPPGLPNV